MTARKSRPQNHEEQREEGIEYQRAACVFSTPFSAVGVDQPLEDERLRIASGGRDAALTLE